jgi:hypothetical protein
MSFSLWDVLDVLNLELVVLHHLVRYLSGNLELGIMKDATK